MSRCAKRNCGAFTLVELLVVIAIIGILASLVVPSVETALKRAKTTLCGSNLRQISIGCTQYAGDHESRLPHIGAWISNAAMMYTMADIYDGGKLANLGLLGAGDYIDMHSDVFFCPLQRDLHFRNSYGQEGHLNASPWLSSEARQEFGWVNNRTGYLRRRFEREETYQGVRTELIGPKAWYADVFSSPDRVFSSHEDSINVVYGSGSVSLFSYDPEISPYVRANYGGNARIFDIIWTTFDNGGTD